MDKVKSIFNYLVKYHMNSLIIACLILLIFIIIKRGIINKFICFIHKIVKKSINKFDDKIVKAIEKPLEFFIIFLGIYFIIRYLYNATGYKELQFINAKLLKVTIILCILWIIYNFNLTDSIIYNKMESRFKEKNKKIMFPFVSIVIRIVIIMLTVLVIVKEFELTTFFAGIGLGGLAIALAAQDTLSNLFGGLVIVLDKPFSIGDWIQTNEIEGIVEEITFRSTKIRTFAKALVTIPNSKLANTNIINWAERNRRRIHFTITIDPDISIESLENCIKGIEKMLDTTKGITKELNIVNFDKFTDTGYEIFIYMYTDIIEYKEYQKMKETINFNILRILEDNGACISNKNEINIKNKKSVDTYLKS